MRWLIAVMLVAGTVLAQDKLFCPVCQGRGLKSEIRVGAGYTTAMATWVWFDSNGVYHYDDPNYTIWEYGCSRGHEFNSRGDIIDSTDNRPWWVLPSPEEADSVRGSEMRVVIYNDTISLTLDTLTSLPVDSTDYTLPDIWWMDDKPSLTLDSLLRRIERLEKRVETEIWRTSYVAILDTTLHSSWFDRVKALEKRLDWLEKNCLKLDTSGMPLNCLPKWKYQPDYLDKDSSIWLENGTIYVW